jgi:hypothetical protein
LLSTIVYSLNQSKLNCRADFGEVSYLVRIQFGVDLSLSHYAAASAFGNDDVIEHSDTDQLSNFAEPIGHRNVFAAGSRIARWVIMHQ